MITINETNCQTNFSYLSYIGDGKFQRKTVTLNDGDVIAVALDDNNEVLDYYTQDTFWETITNITPATSTIWVSTQRLIQERDEDLTYPHDKIALSLLLQEVRLYNNCFGE